MPHGEYDSFDEDIRQYMVSSMHVQSVAHCQVLHRLQTD